MFITMYICKCCFIVHPQIIQNCMFICNLLNASYWSDFKNDNLTFMRILWLSTSCKTNEKSLKTFPWCKTINQRDFYIKINTEKQTFCAFCKQPGVKFSFALWVPEDALIHAADTAERWVWFLIQRLTVSEYS